MSVLPAWQVASVPVLATLAAAWAASEVLPDRGRPQLRKANGPVTPSGQGRRHPVALDCPPGVSMEEAVRATACRSPVRVPA